ISLVLSKLKSPIPSISILPLEILPTTNSLHKPFEERKGIKNTEITNKVIRAVLFRGTPNKLYADYFKY
ncbi:MAG: hypothetical protein ABEJ72_02420, partial [Candidatus Aenigmatarchaeota archaeon]